MVIYHTERALPDVVKSRTDDPTADQKIVGSGNEDDMLLAHTQLSRKQLARTQSARTLAGVLAKFVFVAVKNMIVKKFRSLSSSFVCSLV